MRIPGSSTEDDTDTKSLQKTLNSSSSAAFTSRHHAASHMSEQVLVMSRADKVQLLHSALSDVAARVSASVKRADLKDIN